MHNQYPSNYDQEEQNEQLLRNAELGVILSDVYNTAVNLDPRLADIEIVPMSPNEQRVAAVKPVWARDNESGRHQVHVRLENLDGILAKYEKTMQEIPVAVELFAEQLGIKPDQVTPQLLYIHSFAHEMGHVTELLEDGFDKEEHDRRRREEYLALPIGNTATSALIDPNSNIRKQIDANPVAVFAHLGVSDMDELIEKQARAYRNMTSERIADDFARDVFLVNPQLRDQMTRDTVEPYRNYPQAA